MTAGTIVPQAWHLPGEGRRSARASPLRGGAKRNAVKKLFVHLWAVAVTVLVGVGVAAADAIVITDGSVALTQPSTGIDFQGVSAQGC